MPCCLSAQAVLRSVEAEAKVAAGEALGGGLVWWKSYFAAASAAASAARAEEEEEEEDTAVQSLLKRQADNTLTTSDGRTPLQVAKDGQTSAAMQALLNAGATVIAENVPVPISAPKRVPKKAAQEEAPAQAAEETLTEHQFLDAAKNFDWDQVQAALDAVPALINAQPKNRWSALHQASHSGDMNAVESLLKRQADPTLTTSDGRTPLQVAKDGQTSAAMHDEQGVGHTTGR